MASNNQAPAFVVMALILFAAANPLSHAQILGSLGGLVNGLVNGVSPVVPGVLNSVTPVVPGVLNSVTPVVPGVVNGVSPVVPGLVNGLSPPVSSLLSGLNASGLLCCTANGNCPAGAAGIAGVQVKLNCTNLVGGTVTVGQGTVGANGGFNVSFSNALSTLGGLLNPNLTIPCSVVVLLPLNQTICQVLSTVTGALTGAVSTVQSITSTAGGLIGSVTVPAFSVNATVQSN